MNFEQKVRFLESYQTAKANAETYYCQIVDLRKTMLPNGYHMSDVPKHHNNTDDAMADYAGEFWEINKRLERAQSRMMRVCAVINQIAEESPLGHQILTEIYIHGRTRRDVCEKLYISRNTEYRHWRKAVESLEIDFDSKGREH